MLRDDLALGRRLLELGLVDERALRETLEIQRAMRRRSEAVPPLGELLVARGHIQPALLRQVVDPGRLHTGARALPLPPVASGSDSTALLAPPSARSATGSSHAAPGDDLPAEVRARQADPAALFGKYVILAELGRGGVGVVCKAWDTYLADYVALKRMRPDATGRGWQTEAFLRSLVREARHAVRLRHPHIATLFDLGRIGPEYYISLELLSGRTLAEDIAVETARRSAPPFLAHPRKYLRIVRDVALAVHYAHTRPNPLVHCDLKPGNILLDRHRGAVVLDFGMSRTRTMRDTDDGITGTPAYMAPEQAAGRNHDIDARTDVHGIGAILYTILTGRPPYTGTVSTILHKTLTESPPAPRHELPVASEVADICMRCLRKAPADRYPDARALGDALQSALEKTPAVRLASDPGPGTPAPETREEPLTPVAGGSG